jgi:hypothetical protein
MMNKKSMRFHLEEAKEEMENLIASLDSEDNVTESDFLVGFKHLYFHINFAWNTRRSQHSKV